MAEEKPNEENLETPKEETLETEEEPKEETPKTPEEEDKKPEPEEEEEKAGEEEKPKGEKPSEEESEEDKSKRTPRLMEVWKHNIAEKNWGKEKGKLETTVADLTEQLSRKSSPERAEAIKNLIEKSGMDPEVVEELVKVAEMGQVTLQKELKSLRDEIKDSKEKSLWADEDKRFEQDFEKNVAPLLTSDKVPAENLPRLKKLLKTFAFTEEYAKSPLAVIYRGVDDFQQFLPGAKRKSGEDARGGIRGKEGEKDIMEMTGPEFEAYIAGEKAKEEKFQLRRDGRSVSEE